MIVFRGTPALWAALAEAARVEPGEKTVVSTPANSRVDFTHLLMVDSDAASCGAVVVMKILEECLRFWVLVRYAFK